MIAIRDRQALAAGEPETLRTRDAARCRHRQNQGIASSTVFNLEGNKKMPFFLAPPDDFFHNRANHPGLARRSLGLGSQSKKQTTMKTSAKYILPGILILIAAVCVAPAQAQLPYRKKTKAERFIPTAPARPEGPAKMFYIEGITAPVLPNRARPAPAGFDNLTNGFSVQGPPFSTIDERQRYSRPLIQRRSVRLRRG